MTIISINPSDLTVLGEVECSTAEEVSARVAAAHKALPVWKKLGVKKRVELLREVFAGFAKRKDELALLQSREMGMPLAESLDDFDGSMSWVNWYFDNAENALAAETTFENEHEIHQVTYEPLGVIAVISPWNFPFANLIWNALQAMIAGNVVVMKHSEEVVLFAREIEKEMNAHNMPEGVFSMVYGAGDVGQMLVNEDIQGISFTGSTRTGQALYELAGKKFIKAVMELGGSAPGIIFDDADLKVATGTVCANRLLNQGQCCDGLKRLIVHEDVADEVVKMLKKQFAARVVGPADDAKTTTGPLVSVRQHDNLVKQVVDSVVEGAIIVTGGRSLEQELGGAYYEPTILTNVTPDMRVWTEEVFGPVLPIMTFKTEKEALELANGTPYGLGAYLFTANKKRIAHFANEIESGMLSVNGVNYIQPYNPFGGYKHSGMGREHGKWGFHELTQVKLVARPK